MSENPALEILRIFFAGAGFQEVPPTKTYTRDDLVRVVVGQQWAVACIAAANRLENDRCEWNTVDEMIEAAAEFPCAFDVVEWMEP